MKQPTLWGAGSSALLIAVGLHLAGFSMMPSSNPIQIAGGVPTQTTTLGNSFADMTEGTMTPVTTPETTETVNDNELAETPPPEVSQPVTTPEPIQMAPVSTASLINPVVPVLAATPDTLAPIVPVKPLETITSAAPPKVEPAKPAAKPVVKPRRVKQPEKPTTATPKRQGGTQSARKGQSDGSTAGKSVASGQGSVKARAAGNAAVSKYPGLVMRKISRTRKQRAGARGKATVAFKVSASGAATSVRIINSSGSAKIDQIALRHIKRASPFPRPPKGAQRSFSVVFVSKG